MIALCCAWSILVILRSFLIYFTSIYCIIIQTILFLAAVMPMSNESLALLNQNESEIVSNLELINSGLLTELVSRQVFTENDRQRIQTKRTSEDQAELTLQLFRRKSQYCYDQFIIALKVKEINQSHIANLFDSSGKYLLYLNN